VYGKQPGKNVWLMAMAGLVLIGCVTASSRKPPKTQLQIREYQTRSYDTNDYKMVMKAVLNTLQDEGYIVKNAVLDLGLLTATKEVDVEDKAQVLLLKLLRKNKATWPKNSIFEATANVSEFGSQTRVRLNVQVKTYNNRGNLQGARQIENAKFYQDFFAKVDKGIFIQKENL
jgi:hypothetical protein